MRARHTRLLPTALVLLALLAWALSGSGTASATPAAAEIQARQTEADAARAALDTMNDDLEMRIEEYNAITEALGATRDGIREAQAEVAVATEELAEARARLGRRAANIYKEGGTGVLNVFLGTRTFQEFLTRLDLAARINRADAESVASVKNARARMEASKVALEQREAEQVALQREIEAKAARIEADIRDHERYVAALDSEIQRLLAEEEERQRRLAEQRAREALELAQQRTGAGRPGAEASELGTGRPEVVTIALRYLGVPYRWGGSTPNGFDCSGLTSYCYRQIGINLPRTSRQQFRVGTHIAPDRLDLLLPGDLVFFGRGGDPGRVHHVGIYSGNGNYIHAPQTGGVVEVSSLTERIARRGDYVGASRF